MLNDLTVNDLFETRRMSPLSDFDMKVVFDLYSPLIGNKAVGFYFALYRNEKEKIASFENILKITFYSVGEVVDALNALEAVGLVSTYLLDDEKNRVFTYCLYAPLSPKDFFADPLLSGTLEKYIGKKETSALSKKYSYASLPEGKDISTDFIAYFSPDLNDERYMNSILSSGGKNSKGIKVVYDFSKVVEYLKKLDERFTINSFSKEEINHISKMASLYGYSYETVADFVNRSFDFRKRMGNRLSKNELSKFFMDNIHLDYLKIETEGNNKLIKGDNGLARTLRRAQKLSPVEFLSSLQKGHKPAPADLKIVEELSSEMGLNWEVTNILLMYVLSTQNNALPKAYCEKIAASLVRNDIKTALDAWNYFSKPKKESKSAFGKKSYGYKKENEKKTEIEELKETKAEDAKAEDEDDLDNETFEDIFASI